MSTLGIRVNAVVPWLMETATSTDITPVLDELGVKYTSIEKHVHVAMRLITNESINGRLVALGQSLVMDVMDDEEGGDGGPQYWELKRQDLPHTRRKIAKMYGMIGLRLIASRSGIYDGRAVDCTKCSQTVSSTNHT